jgi:hypothetical protein
MQTGKEPVKVALRLALFATLTEPLPVCTRLLSFGAGFTISALYRFPVTCMRNLAGLSRVAVEDLARKSRDLIEAEILHNQSRWYFAV